VAINNIPGVVCSGDSEDNGGGGYIGRESREVRTENREQRN